MVRRPPRNKKQQKQKSENLAKPETEMTACLLFPALHQKVCQAVEDDIPVPIFHADDDDNAEKEWPTNIMGKFSCTNADCGTSTWGSKRIAILIRGYCGNEYNVVVFNQYCQSCEKLGTVEINESTYVDRVAYRLKKWAGIIMEPPIFRSRKGLPHREDLCEGCRRGYCEKASAQRETR